MTTGHPLCITPEALQQLVRGARHADSALHFGREGDDLAAEAAMREAMQSLKWALEAIHARRAYNESCR